MIIDFILDTRDDPRSYDAKEFYDYVMDDFEEFRYIASALDSGSNADVQKALCTYIDSQGYNPEIKSFVNSFDWLGEYWVSSVGYGVDIFTESDGGNNPLDITMTIYELFNVNAVIKRKEHQIFAMSEDDMKVVTGIDDIEEIRSISDLDLARIIAENSQPYGLIGWPEYVCDFYSAGITKYDDIEPQCLNK